MHSRLHTDYKIRDNLELVFVDVNIQKKKWLLDCCYNKISNHLHHLNKCLNVYMKSHDKILIMGDLNSEVSDNFWMIFAILAVSRILNRGLICFRNPNNPSCIDLFLTITCHWNGYFLLARNGSYCNENSLQKTKSKSHLIQKLQTLYWTIFQLWVSENWF